MKLLQPGITEHLLALQKWDDYVIAMILHDVYEIVDHSEVSARELKWK
jgi:hypothetical protein